MHGYAREEAHLYADGSLHQMLEKTAASFVHLDLDVELRHILQRVTRALTTDGS